MKYCIKEVKRVIPYDYHIILESRPGFLGKLFGKKPEVTTWEGSCTVWFSYPSGKRATAGQEWMLAEILKGAEMRGEITQSKRLLKG